MPNLRKHWFLAATAATLVIGSFGHEVLLPIADGIPRAWLVATILLLMSCPLDLARSLSTRSAVVAAIIGVLVNSFLAGPMAWVGGHLLSEPLAAGLIVAGLAPCTLASAAMWTRMGRGNEAVALTITVVTNLLAFLLIPLGMALLIGEAESISGIALARRLLMIVVLPVALGQLLRRSSLLKNQITQHRKAIGLVAQLGLLNMVFIAAVRSGQLLVDPATRLSVSDWLLLVGVASAVHLALFATAWLIARRMSVARADALGASVGGSQKTLAVGLDLAIALGGVAILPMLVYHVMQLLIDAVLVNWLGPDEKND